MRGILFFALLFCFSSFGQTTYIPDAEVRKATANALWNEVKSKTPTAAVPMMEILIKNDEVFKLYETTMSRLKLEPYDIASVAGFTEDICTEISTGNKISESESVANVKKMQAYYKANGIDTDLDNLKKQQKYDYLILKSIWLGTINEMENKNSKMAKEMATKLLEEYKLLDMSGVTAVVASAAETPKSSPVPENAPTKTVANSFPVKDVVMITTTSYGLGGMYISNDVYVLFENGESLYEPSQALETMDIAASKRANPKHWDRWQIKNNIFYLTHSEDGDTSDWENWFNVRPAKKGFRINGMFKTSDPFTGASIINSSIVYFDAQGRFEWKTTKGGLGGWKPVLVNKNSSGTYEINNRTITLNYSNGTTDSLFFGLYPKDDVHFIIGSSHFVPARK